MEAPLRDSSLDYRTYWLQGGQYYARRGLGAVPCGLPMDKLQSIPEDDRLILLEEAEADPGFCARVAKCMATQPDWAHRISASAKEAIANELDPSRYPARKGSWPKLRARTRSLLVGVKKGVEDAAAALSFEQKMAVVRKVAAGTAIPKPASGLSGLGQWDIIGNLIGTVANVGASIYSANVTANAQRDIAQMQADSAMRSANAQIAMANAQAAINAAQGQVGANPLSSVVSSITSGTIAGVPAWLPLAAGAALLMYFMGRGQASW
jgi:hypothetical protein